MIPNEQGNKITPSCVAWDGTQILVGEAAKNQINRNPKNTVFGEFFFIYIPQASKKSIS